MLTWAPGKARYNIPIITHGEGVYLFDDKGNKFLDWTSQAVCSNLGYSLPPEVIEATTNQVQFHVLHGHYLVDCKEILLTFTLMTLHSIIFYNEDEKPSVRLWRFGTI